MESDQRGATAKRVGLVRVIAVSIHAPLRGATHEFSQVENRGEGFNPRAPAGRDVEIVGYWKCQCFNPRAPAGRDRSCVNSGRPGRPFNPRAPAGRDLLGFTLGAGRFEFQSTRPCGARP